MKAIAGRNRGRAHPPRMLVSVERTIGEGTLRDIYVAGRHTFFDELITAAGGVNAYESDTVPYPVISAEGLLSINPDIIIDMVPEIEGRNLDIPALVREWGTAGTVDAVKNGNVHILTDDYIFVHAGLRKKVPLESQKKIDLLWMRDEFISTDFDFGKRVIFGHTPFKEPLVQKNKIGIDTGAVYGNRLTCVQLPEIEFYSEP